jgi:hypothetical protein
MMEYYDHSDEKFVGGKISVSGNRFEQITIQLMNTESREISKVSLSKNGTFKIPLDWSKNPYSIVVSGPGFLSEERYFFKQESITNFKITLSEIMIKGNIKSHDR